MSNQNKYGINSLSDALAIKLQSLRTEGNIDDERPLFRLDYKDEGKKAPFQYDIVTSKVHRPGCKALREGSEYTLYALWNIVDKERIIACKRCRPELNEKDSKMKKDVTSDIVYGFISILDQFGSVLAERGKEYRNSKHGKQVAKTVNNILSELNAQQKEGVSLAMSSISNLLELVQGYNSSFNGNGTSNNGKAAPERKSKKEHGRTKHATENKKRLSKNKKRKNA